uniref:Uncharacterized protein n=1 Tax=Vespula pensylvanica TaxID=30213 RepID=A0A834UCJ0_VESPE|nr:hypothetical protein H0235_006326 [Vespula pensylvanica]
MDSKREKESKDLELVEERILKDEIRRRLNYWLYYDFVLRDESSSCSHDCARGENEEWPVKRVARGGEGRGGEEEEGGGGGGGGWDRGRVPSSLTTTMSKKTVSIEPFSSMLQCEWFSSTEI